MARRHGRTVAIFGSVAREDEQPGSEIDGLVELAPGTRPFHCHLGRGDLHDGLVHDAVRS